MDLHIGAIVETSDGQDVGIVERVIVDLDTNEVTHYVVHKELGTHRDVMVPAAVADERDRILALRISSGEVEQLPGYLDAMYGLPPSGLPLRTGERGLGPTRGLGAGTRELEGRTVELTKGEGVDCEDGEAGTLDGVVVDELTDEVTDLLVDLTLQGTSAVVPTAWASRLGPGRIRLQCAIKEVQSLAR